MDSDFNRAFRNPLIRSEIESISFDYSIYRVLYLI